MKRRRMLDAEKTLVLDLYLKKHVFQQITNCTGQLERRLFCVFTMLMKCCLNAQNPSCHISWFAAGMYKSCHAHIPTHTCLVWLPLTRLRSGNNCPPWGVITYISWHFYHPSMVKEEKKSSNHKPYPPSTSSSSSFFQCAPQSKLQSRRGSHHHYNNTQLTLLCSSHTHMPWVHTFALCSVGQMNTMLMTSAVLSPARLLSEKADTLSF